MAYIPFLNNAYFSAKVGIGTDSPDAKLEVADIGADSAGLLLSAIPSTNVNFSFIVGDTALGLHSKNLVIKGSSSSSDIAFSPSSSYPGLLTLDGSAGNVGIGTTSPGYKLEVNGQIGFNSGTNYSRIWQTVTDTALANESLGSFRFFNSGAETVRINAAGNVGIGTTSPTGKLDVREANVTISTSNSMSDGIRGLKIDGSNAGIELAGSGNDWWVSALGSGFSIYDTTVDSYRFKILNNGNVGIGTTAPGVKLDVSGQIRSNDSFLLQSGTTAIGSIRNQGGALDIRGDSTRDVSLGSVTSPQALFVEGTNGYVGIGTTSPHKKLTIDDSNTAGEAQFGIGDVSSYYLAMGHNSAGTTDGFIGTVYDNDAARFDIRMKGTAQSDTKVTVLGSGNVGIGTTAPGSSLHIGDGSSAETISIQTGNSNDAKIAFLLADGTERASFKMGGDEDLEMDWNSSDNFIWKVGGLEKARFDGSGNLGIGTTSPFTIGGTAKLSTYASGPSTFGLSSTDAVYLRRYGVGQYQFQTTATGGNEGNLSLQSYGGNVGIGTTSPSQKLEVSGNIKLSTRDDKIMFGSGGTSPAWSAPQIARIGSTMTMSDYSGVQFGGYDGTSYGPRMTVLGTGNVGIGTTSPGYKLDVAGTGNFTGLVSGITPVAAANFVTKAYADGLTPGAGVFLPLAGGTMTGDLTVNANVKYETQLTTNSLLGQKAFIGISSSAGAAKFKIYKNTHTSDGYARFKIDRAYDYGNNDQMVQEAIFQRRSTVKNFVFKYDGDISTTDDIYLEVYELADDTVEIWCCVDDYAQPIIEVVSNPNTSTIYTTPTAGTPTGTLIHSSNPDTETPNWNSHQGAATFSGTITATSGIFSDVATLETKLNGNDSALNFTTASGDVFRIGLKDSDNTFRISKSSTSLATNTYLTIDSSGNATFAGTVTSPTFLGDLNGTINTVTTAVTKANATNDATVATTAFVQNLIGTIPAGLVFQGTWNAATNTPTLTSGSGTTGHFYIVSTSGSTNLDGVTDWVTGDWAVFIEQGGTDAWEKIDNSSVLDGTGTGQTLPLWSGSGTSNTLTDSIITQQSDDQINILGSTATTGQLGQLTIFGYDDGDSNTKYIQARVDNGGDAHVTASGPYLNLNSANYIKSQPVHIMENDVFMYRDRHIRFLDGPGDSWNDVLGLTATTDIVQFGAINSFNSNVGEVAFYSANTENMRLDVDGNLGIGTTSPSTKLHVVGSAGEFALSLQNSSNGDGIKITTENQTANNGFLWNQGSSTLVNMYSSSTTNASKMIMLAGGVDKIFFNTEGNSYFNGGNVGIGTTAPGTKLHVGTGSGATVDTGYQMVIDSSGIAGLQILSATTQSGRIVFGDSGDNDIGMIKYDHTDNSMGFRTNGSGNERMRITSAGNVGIGTDNPGAKLHVTGENVNASEATVRIGGVSSFGNGVSRLELAENTSANVMNYGFSLTADGNSTNNLLIRNHNGTSIGNVAIAVDRITGNVGIGTTSPGAKLEISSADNVTAILNSSSTFTFLDFEKNGANRVQIGNASDGDFIVRTSDAERMRIAADGNVGIGTDSPGAKLEVASSEPIIRLTDTRNLNVGDWDDVSLGKIEFKTSDTTTPGARVLSEIEAYSGPNAASGPESQLRFKTSTNLDTAATTKMTIASSGNVGIGTTTPLYKLDVPGSIRAGGKLTYEKSAGSLDTTGYAVAGLLAGNNGNSCMFTFTAIGNTGHYQKVVYSCWNAQGTWNTSKVIDEGTNGLDIEASANASTITFTFKSRSGSLNYSPRVTIEASGHAINNTYA